MCTFRYPFIRTLGRTSVLSTVSCETAFQFRGLLGTGNSSLCVYFGIHPSLCLGPPSCPEQMRGLRVSRHNLSIWLHDIIEHASDSFLESGISSHSKPMKLWAQDSHLSKELFFVLVNGGQMSGIARLPLPHST